MEDGIKGRARGGKKRAEVLSPEERRIIALKGSTARWGEKPLQATHKGSFKEDFGINVDCYVLNDLQKTAVISQRGMGEALGLGKGGSRLPTFIKGEKIAPYIGRELSQKLEQPLVFQAQPLGVNIAPMAVHGYDVTILIDVCKAIIAAEAAGALLARQEGIAAQAHIIVNASARAGIKGLVYALAGYNPTTQEVIEAFRLYVREEARKYEKEFPNELYLEWHRLYDIPMMERGKPWHFKTLTVQHVYYPLAKSNGKLYELLKALKSKDGGRHQKLFQFLNDVGARALRMQLGRILEMCESSPDRFTYEAKIVERFGGQRELDFGGTIFPSEPPPPSLQSPSSSDPTEPPPAPSRP